MGADEDWIQWNADKILLILSKTKTVEEKLFYLHASINDKLSKRELERQLNSAVFERTLLANQKVSTVLTQLPQNLFKDPYIFEFLDLPDGHSEKDLETALIRNLQKFILEIGKGFTYMGSQYRLQVGNKDYYTDLLFYHRDLQCLVLFELKIQELAQSIQQYLTEQGFICEWVFKAADALEKNSIYNYDCILLDLTLPDGHGFQILKALQEEQKTDGVIIISAKEALETKMEGFQLGQMII